MTTQHITAVLENAPCSGTQKVVLIGLARHAREDGMCMTDTETLARYARVSARAVRVALQSLVDSGLVEDVDRYPVPLTSLRKFRLTTAALGQGGEDA